MEELRDIQPNVAVPDASLWIVIALGLLALLVIVTLLVVAWRHRRRRPEPMRDAAIAQLQVLDFRDPKSVAYEFTRLAHYAVTPRHAKEHQALLQALETYKYEKEVPTMIDRELRQRMRAFIAEVSRG